VKIEESIGGRIKARREYQQMTLEALGSELEQYLGKPWTPQAVWQAERGQRDFRAEQLIALALALEVPVVQLLAPYPGSDEQVTLGAGYELTAEGSDKVFAAVGTPGVGPALLKIEMELEGLADDLMLAGKSQQEHARRVFRAADTLMSMIAKANESPKVKARRARGGQK
jgi:transcriptional regulator with XRE-family HTH domain